MKTQETLVKKHYQLLDHHSTVQITTEFTQEHKQERKIEFEELCQTEDKIKQDIAFWNSMADGKLQSTVTICNLFVLLMILSLAHPIYNGPNPERLKALGWVTCSITIFVYSLGFILKVLYIPRLQKMLKEESYEWARIYKKVHDGEKKIQNLTFSELIEIETVLDNRSHLFRILFSDADVVETSIKINKILGGNEQVVFKLKEKLEEIKTNQTNAKWWQSFWQGYVTGKTFSIPSIVMLVFIITPLSNATKDISLSLNNAQGWLAVGFWAACILAFILIKCCLWDSLNEKVEQAQVEPLYLYGNVYTKRKEIKDLSLSELETLDKLMRTRSDDFVRCFPEVQLSEQQNEVKKAISKLLPKRESEDEEERLREIIRKANALKNTHAVWLGVFNTKIVHTIITSLKFFIVIALTFVQNYPETKAEMRTAQQILGIFSLGCMGCGYIFYVICSCYLLSFLQTKAHQGRSSPFSNYRLVYFGNKSLSHYEVYELQDLNEALTTRMNEFIECFPKTNFDHIHQQVEQIIRRKKLSSIHLESVSHLLRQETEAKNSLQFWTTFSDGPLYLIIYSCYVELVVLIVTLTSGDAKSSATLGWLGVGLICLLIVVVIIFKAFVLPYQENYLKSCRVDGFSEFNLVYLKKKQLKEVSLIDLHKIYKAMEKSPGQFKKCFPTTDTNSISKQIQHLIDVKAYHQNNYLQNYKDQVEQQQLLLSLARHKEILAFLTKIIQDRFYPTLPIALVIEILWVQSIATDKYGLTVNGFLGVGILFVVAFFITFFKIWLEEYLKNEIKQKQMKLRLLQRKRH